ncbi:MAG: DUF2828 family protein [Lachnospiraceae bacterium]|nr:DUF2828 family protein [Lachnospiraceae bacterium]
MNFSEVIRQEAKWTKTENGADVKNTTESALLDLFAEIGAMRTRPDGEIIQKFELAWQEDPLGAVRCAFYARDIRGGLGERRVFRVLLPYMAEKHPEALFENLGLIGFYGRYDDLYSLVGTKLEDLMWQTVKAQLAEDEEARRAKKPCSLLAKWLKKADATSQNTKKLGIYTAKKLDMSVYDYKRLCNRLRKHIDVVEQRMSAQAWETIHYPSVPSRAMMQYRNAFGRHDEERFSAYLDRVHAGEEKIRAAALYPYDIVEKLLYKKEDSRVLEAQWSSLPDYVGQAVNAMVMADVSGSMSGRPMATSIGLAMYFAERNQGAYHNLFMTFSGEPQFVEIKGTTIREKITFISKAHWEMNTDLEAALFKILEVAKKSGCAKDEMPKALLIVSDMEIDRCAGQNYKESFCEYAFRAYNAAGYQIPNLIFWNVSSRHDVFLADKKRKGVQLVSGQSAGTFRHVLAALDRTPAEAMYQILNSERYGAVGIKKPDRLP